MGPGLYTLLTHYFVHHLRSLRDVRTYSLDALPGLPHPTRRRADLSRQASDPLVDEPLLRYYAQEWDRYTTAADYVNRVFMYLNRHWVKREKDKGRKNVYAVYTVRCLPILQDPR